MNATVIKNNVNPKPGRSKIHPQKFALGVACASMVMMFAGFTSAFVVRQAAGNWLEFNIPTVFFWNTALIIASSFVLHASYSAFKKGQFSRYKTLLVIGSVMGIAFVVLQYIGWQQLSANGVELIGNPSGSFFYVITGVHAAHVLGGVCALLVALVHAFSLRNFVTPQRKHRLDLTVTYWHFVDGLWLYLIIFLLLNS